MKKLYALLLATTSLVYSCQNEKPFDENVDRQTYISDKGNCDSMSVNFTNKLAAEYYCKSTEYLEKNDFKNALKWALSAEKSEPNNIMLLKDISLIYSQLNQISVAKLYLKKVFEIDSTYGLGWHQLSGIYLLEENYSEALVASNRAISTNRLYGPYYVHKVFAHYFLNQKDSACHYLKTLIAVDQHGSYNMFKSNFRAMECFE